MDLDVSDLLERCNFSFTDNYSFTMPPESSSKVKEKPSGVIYSQDNSATHHQPISATGFTITMDGTGSQDMFSG